MIVTSFAARPNPPVGPAVLHRSAGPLLVRAPIALPTARPSRCPPCDLLVARVKITSYNLHRGSFLPEPWFWQTQVYSEGSRSRVFVIPSSEAQNPTFFRLSRLCPCLKTFSPFSS